MDNLIIVSLFGFLLLSSLTQKLANDMRGLYDCVKLILPQTMRNVRGLIRLSSKDSYIRNIQQLMTEVIIYLKDLSQPIMNKIFMLRNIPYCKRNLRDLDNNKVEL